MYKHQRQFCKAMGQRQAVSGRCHGNGPALCGIVKLAPFSIVNADGGSQVDSGPNVKTKSIKFIPENVREYSCDLEVAENILK